MARKVSQKFLQTDTQQRQRRMKVVAYKDLRPIDWVSGEKMALPKGEGNICDRCSAEHVHVYTVQDQDSGEQFDVGSGCAKRAFGFDPSLDIEGKKMMKRVEREAAERAEAQRTAFIEREVARIAPIVGRLVMPEARLLETKLEGGGRDYQSEKWGIGDATTWEHGVRRAPPADYEARESRRYQHQNTVQTLMQMWATNRAGELLPAEIRLRSDRPASELARAITNRVTFKLTHR